MPSFNYTARDAAGIPQRGVTDAPAASVVVNSLRARGLIVLSVEEVGGGGVNSLSSSLNIFGRLPPRSIDVETGLRQISTMLRSGLTLLSALRIAGDQTGGRAMKRIWGAVAKRIEEGASLTDAMKQHRCFGRLVLQLTLVGEQTGELEHVLRRAADTMERRRVLTTNLFTALMYPSIVFVAAIGAAGFMIGFVIPKLKVFLDALGRKLPPMTQALVDISAWLQIYLVPVLIGVAFVAGLAIALWLWPPGRLRIDRASLRLPLIGRILRIAGTVQFSHSLGILLRSGVTLLEALDTMREMHGNQWLALQVDRARQNVMRGGSLADPLKTPHTWMPMLGGMVSVGEQAGTLDEVLEEVTQFHEEQLQSLIRRLATIIEPVVVVVVGGIVGFVYISFFVALFAAAGTGK